MVNRYTADRRIRSDDAYTPGGKAGSRPDRSVIVYAQRCARSVQRRADRHRRHRSEPAAHRALRLLVGEGATFRVCSMRRPTCCCTATPSARSSKSRTASPRANRSARSTTCAAPRSYADGVPEGLDRGRLDTSGFARPRRTASGPLRHVAVVGNGRAAAMRSLASMRRKSCRFVRDVRAVRSATSA